MVCIKKRWQEYTEELYKNDLHDQDNHDSMVTHLEPDILECEVKWALERNGMDLIEAEDIKMRWQEYTELYKQIFMTQITTMVRSLI